MVPSMRQLSEYLRNREFISAIVPWNGQGLPWKGLTCLVVVSYVLKFCSDTKHDTLSKKIKRLDTLASEYNSSSNFMFWCVPSKIKKEQEISKLLVNSFMPEAQKFFTVNELKVKTTLKVNELLIGFLTFLLQILNSEAEDKDRYAPLRKELTFLLSVLGDVPFQFPDSDEVMILLEEFEVVANEAGGFIYSCVFVTGPVNMSWYQENERVFLVKVELLKPKIKEHCIKFTKSRVSVTTRVTVFVNSLLIIDSLLEDIENLMNHRVDLSDHMKDLITTLQKELMCLSIFVKDINVIGEIGIDELKDRIGDVVYEAEYLINSSVVGYIPLEYLSYRLSNVVEKIKLIDIKKIYDTKVSIVKDDDNISVVELSLQVIENRTNQVESTVVGFDDETIKVLGELTGGSRSLQTISVCGMAGIGKTTLAKKLYNDPSVTYHFDEIAWCVVSQKYHMKKVLIEILMCLTRRPSKEDVLRMDIGNLELRIHKSLKGRRYFIVMDDVWDSNVWNDLRCFPDDKNGSRIIFTSQNKDTAPNGSVIHTLPLLSEDQCWVLLEKRLFHQEPCPPELPVIGRQIAAKCNGLPLAIVVLAGALGNMEKEKHVWEKVNENIDSYIFDGPSNCMKILELSYEQLPNHLKSCFLYFAAFPEESEISVQKLIWLWIAEGFIWAEEKSPEDVAKEYLMDLVGRSLVQIAKSTTSTGGVKTCSIHDLLREMCVRKADKETFLKLIIDDFSIFEKHNRLCVHSALESSRPFGLQCRSFLGHLSDPSSCFYQMKLLKILHLRPDVYNKIFYKLKGIEYLVHLRYLAVNQMPQQIASSLLNLQCLIVVNTSTVKLPTSILQLVKLRHLRLKIFADFVRDCEIRQTNNLRTLSCICIYSRMDEEILKSSPHLRKLKCICDETIFPDFYFFTKLESLKVEFHFGRFKGKLKNINFPFSIKKLSLSGVGLPWEEMSIIGKLPKLMVLKLSDKAFVGEEWETREGEFQELRFLKLEALSLEIWTSSNEHFPNLRHLVLVRCFYLQGIPTELGDIPTLEMIEVHDCTYWAVATALEIKEEVHENGNEEFKVIIGDVFERK